MVHLPEDRREFAAVASCGLVSLIAIAGVLTYSATVTILKHRPSGVSPRLRSSALFLETPSGILLLCLLSSGLLQSLGFTLSFHWMLHGDYFPLGVVPSVCLLQSILIQFGDVAQALFSLAISIYTAGLIIAGIRLRERALFCTIISILVFTAITTLVGPAYTRSGHSVIVQGMEAPFYCGANEPYCWVHPMYKGWRVPIHFIWTLATAILNLLLYIAVFVYVRYNHLFRSPRSQTSTSYPADNKSYSSDDKESCPSSYSPSSSPTSLPSSVHRVDSAAFRMLAFPIVYILCTLPITAFRIADLSGNNWGKLALTICSCIYALTGLTDVILCSMRSLFRPRAIESSQIGTDRSSKRLTNITLLQTSSESSEMKIDTSVSDIGSITGHEAMKANEKAPFSDLSLADHPFRISSRTPSF